MSGKVTNNDKKRNRVLFDFESIVDMKISYLISYTDTNESLEDLKFRRLYDFGSILDGIEVDEEDYYHPKRLVFTSMMKLLNNYLAMEDIKVKVLCKDEYQERIIKRYFPKAPIIKGTRDKVNWKNFTRIILGDCRHTLEFKYPVATDFMILSFRDNFIPENAQLLPKEILTKVADINTITIVNPYPEIPTPVG